MTAEGFVEKGFIAHVLEDLLEAGGEERRYILRRLALSGILDQAHLEDDWVRGVDHRQSDQPGIATQRRRPGNRTAPIMADQSKAFDRERVGESENVTDQCVGRVRLDLLRAVRSREPALIRYDQIEIVPKLRHDVAPGAMRFGKAGEQDDRRIRWIAGQWDV